MATITTRSGKGSPLTNTEVDNNFTNLNTAKYESGSSAVFSQVNVDVGDYNAVLSNNILQFNRDNGFSYVDQAGTGGLVFRLGETYDQRLNISAAEVVFNEESDDVDFRVESNGKTHMFYVDGTYNRIGINNSAPAYLLTINKDTTSGTAASVLSGINPIVYIDAAASSDQSIVIKTHGGSRTAGGIKFASSPDGVNYNWAGMSAIADQNGAARSLEFRTATSNTDGATSTERLTLSPTETTFNTTNASTDFRVATGALNHAIFADSSQSLVFIGTNTNNHWIDSSINSNTPSLVDFHVNQRMSVGAYTYLGQGHNNSGNLAFNLTPDQLGNYYPQWAEQAGAGGAIIRMPSGGNGGLEIRTARFGQDYSALTTADMATAIKIADTGAVTINNSSEEQDFVVKSSGNSNMLFVDGVANRVGIGAGSSPNATLHVGGNLAVNGGAGEYYGVQLSGGEGANPKVMIGDWHNASATLQWNSTSHTFSIDAQYGSTAKDIYLTGNDGASTYAQFNDTKMVLHTRVTHSSSEDTLTTTNNTQIAQWSMAGYESAKAVMTVTQGSNRQVSEILITHDGSSYAYMTEYAVLTTNGTLCEFSVGIDGANFRLLAKPVSSSSTVVRGVYQSQNS